MSDLVSSLRWLCGLPRLLGLFAGLVGLLGLYRLLESVGSFLLLPAAALWSLVVLSLLYSTGRFRTDYVHVNELLSWITDGYSGPSKTRGDPLKPNGVASPSKSTSTASPPYSGSISDKERERIKLAAEDRIKSLKGITAAKRSLQELIVAAYFAAGRGDRHFGTIRPGILISLYGPHGTGKTTVAKELAAYLFGSAVIGRHRLIELGQAAFAEGYSPVEAIAEEAALESLEGTLLIDDADWLFSSGVGAGEAVGLRVAKALGRIASSNPGKLTVIVVGSSEMQHKLTFDARYQNVWGKNFHTHGIEFEPISDANLGQIFRETLTARSAEYVGGDQSILSELSRQRQRSPDDFRNADAARILADVGRSRAVLRLKGKLASDRRLRVEPVDIQD